MLLGANRLLPSILGVLRKALRVEGQEPVTPAARSCG